MKFNWRTVAILVTLTVTFVSGAVLGYSLKSWKIDRARRKKELLLKKIKETELELKSLN